MAENLDPAIIAALSEEYRRQSESMRESNLIADAQAKAEKAKLDINKGFTTAVSATTSVFVASTRAVESFTRALTSNESSFKQAAGAASVAADVATDVVKHFGVLGGLAGALIQTASKVVQAASAQSEAIVKAKDQVTKFGAAGNLSSDRLLQLADRAGYFSLNMHKLYSAAGKAGGDLLVFSKNMSRGVETFAEIAAVGDGVLSEFNSLGIPKEELAEYMADYVKSLGAAGVQLNANQKTQAALQKGSLEYTKNILELSALTGKDVDTVKKKQQEAQASLDIMIRHNKMQAQAADLRRAGDKDAATALEEQVKKEQAIITAVSAQYSSSMTASVRSAIATGGALTDLSRNLGNMAIDPRVFVEMAKSSMTPGQAAAAAIEKVAGGVKYASETFGDSIIYSAGSQDELGKTAFGVVEDLQQLAKGAGETAERQKTVFADINKTQVDGFKSIQNQLDIMVRMFQKQYDAVLMSLNPFVNSLTTIIDNVKTYMKQILSATWDFLKKEVLEPANKYIKDRFGIDIKEAVMPVINKMRELATEAHKLWVSMGGLNGIIKGLESVIKKIIEYFPLTAKGAGAGAVLGGIVGGVAGGPAGAVAGIKYGAAAGAAVGAGSQYLGNKYEEYEVDKKIEGLKDRYLPNWMRSNREATRGAPSVPNSAATRGSSDFGAFDPGVGDDWGDNKSTGSKRTSTNTRSMSPPPELADELAQGQRNLGGATPNKAATPTRGSTPPGGSTPTGGSTTSAGLLKGPAYGLDSELHRKLMAAAEVYGKPLTINSGLRTYAEQKKLWDDSVRLGHPGIGPTGMLVAEPGNSAHEKGIAVDIQEAKTDPKAVMALLSQGLRQPYGARDPVHFELLRSRTESASIPSSRPSLSPEAASRPSSRPSLSPEAASIPSSALTQTASAKQPVSFEVSKPQLVAESKPSSKTETSTSTQSSPATGTSVASSEETYARMLYDIKDSITTAMQGVADKVSDSNNILERIFRYTS